MVQEFATVRIIYPATNKGSFFLEETVTKKKKKKKKKARITPSMENLNGTGTYIRKDNH